ncbi:MAG: hypothetical protein M3R25_08280 [Bacteroidota bacterium]|nr:hypothetical protein [Bacteroidota bacterium]
MMKTILPLVLLGCMISCAKKETGTNEKSGSNQNINLKATTSTEEYFNLPRTLSLPDKPYLFVWSSHPTPEYYKQEYLPAGQTGEHFSEMVLVEVVLGDHIMHNVAFAKAKEINTRKMTDPLAAYNLGKNDDKQEVYLDFILSEGEGDKAVAEWNVYRYKKYTDSKGNNGIALFAWSRRAYGEAVHAFAQDLITNRKQYILPFMNQNFPAIAFKDLSEE